MRIIDFPNPKINRPKLDLQNDDYKKISETFDLIESYMDTINPYIFNHYTYLYL